MAELKRISSTVLLATLLLFAMSQMATSQNCGCAPDLCCSKYGFCGNTDEYCGEGCQGGPCRGGSPNGGSPNGGDPPVSLDGTVTDEFFNSILSQAGGDNCPGKGFFTRENFIAAANSYPEFGSFISKREIAAFFANVAHETGFMCKIEEDDGPSKDYCDEKNTEFPCAAGKGYYGRGPLQLTGNQNYGSCGRDLGVNLLDDPDMVAKDPVLSFKTAFWYWTKNVRFVFSRGFGATIQAINGALECNGANSPAVASRVQYFKDFCGKLGVDPGDNLSC